MNEYQWLIEVQLKHYLRLDVEGSMAVVSRARYSVLFNIKGSISDKAIAFFISLNLSSHCCLLLVCYVEKDRASRRDQQVIHSGHLNEGQQRKKKKKLR